MPLEGAWPRAGEQTSPAHSQGGRGGRTNRSQPRAWSWNQPAPDDETQEGEGKRQDQRILLENRARESQRPPAVGTAKRAPGRGQTRDVIPRRKKTTTGLWGAPRLRMARKKNVNLKKKNQCSQRPTADVTERASQGRERARVLSASKRNRTGSARARGRGRGRGRWRI